MEQGLFARQDQRVAPGCAEFRAGMPAALSAPSTAGSSVVVMRVTGLILAKQGGVSRAIGQGGDGCADAARHRHFGQRDGKPAVAEVMAGGDCASENEGADGVAIAALDREVDRGRRALFAAGNLAQPDRLAEPAGGRARKDNGFAGGLEGIVAAFVTSAMTPTPPMVGVAKMPLPLVSL